MIEPARLTEPTRIVKAAAMSSTTPAPPGCSGQLAELQQGDDGRGATAHAVEQRDHLRHLGHLHPVGTDGADGGPDGDRSQNGQEMIEVGADDHGDARDERSGSADQVSPPGRPRRGQSLQRHDEADGRQQVGQLRPEWDHRSSSGRLAPRLPAAGART